VTGHEDSPESGLVVDGDADHQPLLLVQADDFSSETMAKAAEQTGISGDAHESDGSLERLREGWLAR
jgi:hypothetical protein